MKRQRGQVLVEFALCIVLFSVFVFGLIAFAMWGAASFFTQEISHEVARKYAVTEDFAQAEKRGKVNMGRMAYMFIEPSTVQVQVRKEGNTSVSRVTAKPRIEKFLIFNMPYISKTSEATIEHYIRFHGAREDQYVGRTY